MKVDPRWRTVAGIVLLALAYVLAARLGLLFAFEQAQVSPIWPPTGLALAALMRFGLRFWPGVFLGALAANSYAGAPLAVAAGIAVGNTLEAAVAVYVQRRFFKFQPEFERMRGVTAFVIIAAMASTMISATIGVTSLGLGGLMPWENFAANWRTWWLGDALGALVVAPVLFTWSRRESFPPRRGIIPEAIVLAALVTAVSWFAFTHGLGFRFLVFPPLIWAALRFGPRGATLATLAASAIAAWHTMHDVGPFAGEPIMDRLHYVQIFAGVDALTVLFLAATKREREWARDRLREQRDQLEVQVAARTAELAASHAELQDFLDNASDLIQSVDADGRYRFVNRAWCATLGYRADEVAALTLFDVIAPQQHAHCGEAFRRLLATREPLRIETEFRAKDGRAVLVEGLVNACAEAGQRAFTRGVFRDITDRKLAERQLVANLAREKELNELKSQFVSMASHELRTPLATLSLGVDFLANHRRRLGDDEIEKSFGTLRDGVRQLRTILEQLLLLGRDEDGKIHCHPTPTDLAAFLQKLADEEQAADKRRHPIAVECALGGSPARVDPQLLRHILHNLLSNACKYSPEGQPVRIGAALRDDRLELTVADRGIGIPPEDQPRLFSFFFRGRNVGGVAGSGLGLLVVRRCVEAHGGAIAFTSALGAGTRFVVTLPLNPVSP